MLYEPKGYFIHGRKVDPSKGERFESFNPATGAPLVLLGRGRAADVDAAVESAAACFATKEWRRMAPADRGRLLLKVSAAIRQHEDELARLESSDVGKPVSQALNDVRTAARYFEYYGGMADKVLGSVIPVRWGVLDLTMHEPYGVSAQIIPWNFPISMGARGIAPSLAAGNCVVAKPAEQASLTILRLAELAFEAGLPAGAFNVVTGLGAEAGAALTENQVVRHITFTGSVATGTAVMKSAANGVRPVALELGGKSPNIVFADVDLAKASEFVARSIVVNAGQTCNACTRLIVHESAHDGLLDLVRGRFDKIRMGNPTDNPDLGPVITADQRKRIRSYLELARNDGADMSLHGAEPTDEALSGGYFQQIAVIDGLNPQHKVYQEEIFGPVLAVTSFSNVEEALALANGSEYGLVAGVWTKDVSLAMQASQRIESGQVYINGWGTGGSVEVPFGGYKKSGIGREKGEEGLLHYMQTKSISTHF
ncbi:MAG TPA: aldehyde dehydrogenase family protein [Alphaproteobacteria bacterium]